MRRSGSYQWFASGAVAVLLLASGGCASNRISQPDVWAPGTDVERATVWTFFWGAMQQNITPTNCLGPGMAEVTVRSNLGYSLLSVLSLGTAMPVTIEWRCSKDTPADSDDF